jgi:chromosome partitioning protein
MRTYAISNQKGGAGKTTMAVNLSAALADRDLRVLLIDLDPQASSSGWFGIEGTEDFYEVLTDEEPMKSVISETSVSNLDFVASSDWLLKAEKFLSGEVGAEKVLRERIGELPDDEWDLVMIDCAPSLGTLTVNAFAAADSVLVPVQARVIVLNGLAKLMNTIDVVQERLNESLEIGGIVANQVDRRTKHAQEVVEKLRDRFDDLVYETVIRENIRLAEAPSYHQPITEYDPSSYGAEDYHDLADEFLDREGLEV